MQRRRDPRRGSVASDVPTPGNVENAALRELPLGAAQPPAENRLCDPARSDCAAPPQRETPVKFATMAETTPPKPGRKRERDVVVEPELSEYELHRNKRIKENQAFLASLGLGDAGQKLPKKPSATRKRKRKVEEHEKRKSVRLAGGPAPIERLQDDPRSYTDYEESRKRRKRAPRQEPWEPTDEQRERLGIFCMEGFYDWLGTTTKYDLCGNQISGAPRHRRVT